MNTEPTNTINSAQLKAILKTFKQVLLYVAMVDDYIDVTKRQAAKLATDHDSRWTIGVIETGYIRTLVIHGTESI